MIDRGAAEALLDFGSRIGQGQRANEQLDAAVAIHNILLKNNVAYLADEVGMGKTYVALGAVALFRHFNPNFRVLVIAPRENIQSKWMKEFRNFIEHNVRYPDLRVKAIDGRSARPMAACSNLLNLVHQSVVDPNRDFFLRLTSFSLPIAGSEQVDSGAAYRLRDELRRHLPWMKDEVFDLRNKQEFKDNVARAVCCALPEFDLVIVDEAHNLKHGFSESGAARNRVLASAFGRRDETINEKLFPNYRRKAKRVLFLSATPIEETYTHLWNQLDLFGLGNPFTDLKSADTDPKAKKEIAARFLVRRVTTIHLGGKEYTKNLYRREWRRGGVDNHDEPIRVTDPRKRLIVALVQKKVSELLGHERFNSSFQIGMLASFESFLETARVKKPEEDAGNFDDAEQTDDDLEREGVDVGDVNRLARSYRTQFGMEMPHPKLDAVVDGLSSAWQTGAKSLIFVRRVASVKELKRKLDEKYDAWLLSKLRRELPENVLPRFEQVVEKYKRERAEAFERKTPVGVPVAVNGIEDDRGGIDTFFAWFFRGEGPRGIVSGANIQQRFVQRSATYATFFEDNYVADVLGCRPQETIERMASVLSVSQAQLGDELRNRAARFLSRAKRHARGDRFEAAQAAAIEWLKEIPGSHQDAARTAWHERFERSIRLQQASEAPDVVEWLNTRTFFTELRQHPELRKRIWPQPAVPALQLAFRERELRGQLLASAARLGHAFIDLYLMTMKRLKDLEPNTQEGGDENADIEIERINDYIALLERQMSQPLEERSWAAFDELADLSENFDLILDSNAPDARSQPLAETARTFGQLLRQQQPNGGMSGQVNQTLVRQFRMPGYPLVLVSTDLLQEGEDLHTFCSSVQHYGISWTPSSMEQRIGRIDRVRSHTDRRLSRHAGPLAGPHLLQVFFPHLEDTVEVLQVQRVLERMNNFIRLMHEGLSTVGEEEKRLNAAKEFARGRRVIPQILEPLKSAFPVRPEFLRGDAIRPEVGPELASRINERFTSIQNAVLPGLDVRWEPKASSGLLLGTVFLGNRQQPFSLMLQSLNARPLVRCISPVGCVEPEANQDDILDSVVRKSSRIGAIDTEDDRKYDLTVEEDVMLADDPVSDIERISLLIRRVVQQADELEQEHLPGKDESLDSFRSDLEMEGNHGR